MDLFEYQARDLFEKHGVPVLAGAVATTPEEAESAAASMGGKFPGVYPKKMRIIAVVNMILLSFLMMIVLVKAGLILPQFLTFSEIAIWFVVAFYSIGTVLNTITPSKIERIWAPVAAIQLITTIVVAI